MTTSDSTVDVALERLVAPPDKPLETLSDLIAFLRALEVEYGHCPVLVSDPDSQGMVPASPEVFRVGLARCGKCDTVVTL
jgi:hypothetical protein